MVSPNSPSHSPEQHLATTKPPPCVSLSPPPSSKQAPSEDERQYYASLSSKQGLGEDKRTNFEGKSSKQSSGEDGTVDAVHDLGLFCVQHSSVMGAHRRNIRFPAALASDHCAGCLEVDLDVLGGTAASHYGGRRLQDGRIGEPWGLSDSPACCPVGPASPRQQAWRGCL